MSHFQTEIDRRCRGRQRPDGNVINAGGCNPPDIFQSDASTRFELDVVSPQRQSFPNLSGRHVVKKDNVDTIDLDESSGLLQIVSLHFDADLRPFLAKLANLVGEPGKSPKGGQVIVLYQNHVVQPRTVINATTSQNRGLFQNAEARS